MDSNVAILSAAACRAGTRKTHGFTAVQRGAVANPSLIAAYGASQRSASRWSRPSSPLPAQWRLEARGCPQHIRHGRACHGHPIRCQRGRGVRAHWMPATSAGMTESGDPRAAAQHRSRGRQSGYLAWHGAQIIQASGRGPDAAKSRTDKPQRQGAKTWQASQRPGHDRAGRSLRSLAGISDHQVTRAQPERPASPPNPRGPMACEATGACCAANAIPGVAICG